MVTVLRIDFLEDTLLGPLPKSATCPASVVPREAGKAPGFVLVLSRGDGRTLRKAHTLSFASGARHYHGIVKQRTERGTDCLLDLEHAEGWTHD